ncbi:MAG: CopD family protein [Candidatus Bipolaricaulota bacterium]
MTKLMLPAGILFLHNVFTVVWIGGMITLSLIILPVASKVLGRGAQTKELVDRMQSRLSWFVWVSIAGLLLTGVLLSKRAAALDQPFSFATTYAAVLSVKHIAVGLMVALAATRRWFLRSKRGSRQRGLRKASLVLLVANTALGLLVLLLSSMGAVLNA